MVIIQNKGIEQDIFIPKEDGVQTPPSKKVYIDGNGTYVFNGRTEVTVDVPKDAQGSIDITGNGTFDVTDYAEANVSVRNKVRNMHYLHFVALQDNITVNINPLSEKYNSFQYSFNAEFWYEAELDFNTRIVMAKDEILYVKGDIKKDVTTRLGKPLNLVNGTWDVGGRVMSLLTEDDDYVVGEYQLYDVLGSGNIIYADKLILPKYIYSNDSIRSAFRLSTAKTLPIFDFVCISTRTGRGYYNITNSEAEMMEFGENFTINTDYLLYAEAGKGKDFYKIKWNQLTWDQYPFKNTSRFAQDMARSGVILKHKALEPNYDLLPANWVFVNFDETDVTENGTYNTEDIEKIVVNVQGGSQEEIERLQREVERLTGELNDAEAEIVRDEEQIRALQEQINALNAEIENLRQEAASLTEQVNVLQGEKDALEAEKTALQARLNSITSTTITENGTYVPEEGVEGWNSVTINVSSGDERIAELEEKIRQLDAIIDDKNAQIRALNLQVETLQDEVNDKDAQIQALNEQINGLLETVETQAGQIRTLTSEKEALEARLNTITSKEITENGVYTPQSGVEGWNSVTVNVPSMSYVEMTQSEYDALAVKDNNTFYIIEN